MLTGRKIRGGDADKGSSGSGLGVSPPTNTSKFPKVEDFLSKRDFVGALTLLEFQRSVPSEKHGGRANPESLIPYCAFHLGDYQKALEEYLIRMKGLTDEKEIGITWLNIACCYFALGMYSKAAEAVERGQGSDLEARLLFHLAHKLGQEDTVMERHAALQETTANLLSLASIHYLRADFQSAIDIYKKMLLTNSALRSNKFRYNNANEEDSDAKDADEEDEGYLEEWQDLSDHLIDLIKARCPNQLQLISLLLENKRDLLALNVYVALCYHRLEYYDVSQEVLAVYLQSHPDSAIALNLKACNTFRLYTGARAESELRPFLNIMQHDEQSKQSAFSNSFDLIRHNLVVFRNGEGALQVLPKLLDVIPEARLNLIIYYLHQEDTGSAYNLIKDTKPTNVPEFILHAIVNVTLSQQYNNTNREYLGLAQKYYTQVGQSQEEHDSVFGRLCMASAHFLNKNFQGCVMYLNSVRTHYYNDDTFNYNYGQALAMLNQFKEAETVLLMVQNEKIRNEFIYIQHLARCYVMNRKPRLAWELYDKMDTGPEAFKILQLVANECYRMGQFYYAAKAFDILEKFDPTPENWEGKRGACVGVFQLIIANQEPKDSLPDIIALLRQSSKKEVEKILSVMKKWARDKQYNL